LDQAERVTTFATFDLEVAKDFPDGASWRQFAPLGITCAAIGKSGHPEPSYFHAEPQLSRAACIDLVRTLEHVVASGATLVTWNGTAFDFAVLAQESDLVVECAQLALEHVDLMLIVTFQRGHFLSMQKALLGAGIAGKRQEVTLKDGTVMREMSGKHAPQLWARGEHSAVLSYLRQDVMSLVALAENVGHTRSIRWMSSKGNPNSLAVPRLLKVRECFRLPLPDTGWMNAEPPQRERMIEWMPPLADFIPSGAYAPRQIRELPLFAYAANDPYWNEFRARI
jgi:hypothetical protein